MKKKLLTVPSMENNSIEETQEALVNLQDVAKAQKETDIVVDSIVTLTEAGEIVQESLKGIETQDGMVFEDVSTQSYKVGIALESARGMLKKDFKDLYESINVPKVSIESITKTPNHALSISLEGALDFLKAVGRKIKEFIKMLIDKIKKFFGFIIKFFKGTEKDIKEQAKNLEKDKFDIKDPSVANKNTKYYSKKDVLDAVDSKDPKLSGLNEVIGAAFKGEVNADLSLDDLVRKVKEIILRPEGDADSLKAEIIAYVNANLTDKKIEEKRNTVVDLSEITEDFLAVRKIIDGVVVDRSGGTFKLRGKDEVVNDLFDEEEFKTKFKYFLNGGKYADRNFKLYRDLLLEEKYDSRAKRDEDPLRAPYWGAFDRFKTETGKNANVGYLVPIDDPSSPSFFDSWLAYEAISREGAGPGYTIGELKVVSFRDGTMSDDLHDRMFYKEYLSGDIEKVFEFISDNLYYACGLSSEIIKYSSEIEKKTKEKLEDFETNHAYKIADIGSPWVGYGVNNHRNKNIVRELEKNQDYEHFRVQLDNLKMLCKIYYELSKYWLRFPIGTKRVIDYFRSVINESLYIKVKG